MKRTTFPLLIAVLTLIGVSGTRTHAFPPPGGGSAIRYDVFAIQAPPGWTQAVSLAVNDAGRVVGYLSSSNGVDALRPFVADFNAATGLWAATILDTAPLGIQGGAATDINNAGQIVGYISLGPQGLYAYAWEWDAGLGAYAPHDLTQDLGGSGPRLHQAMAINERGEVVCRTSNQEPPNVNGLILDGIGTGGVLALVPIPYVVYDLNDASPPQVAVEDGAFNRQAVWQAGAATLIASTTAGYPSINDAGQVAGPTGSPSGNRGYLSAPPYSSTQLLNTLGGAFSGAEELSNAGQVVGVAANKKSARGALWENGSPSPIDLNTIAAIGNQWTLGTARAICRTGMQSGTGRYLAGSGTYQGQAQGYVLKAR